MDTLKNIPSKLVEDFDSLHLADLTDDERSVFADYVSLSRDVIESKQLFDAFYFNLLNMHNCFDFYLNDTVKRTDRCPQFGDDFVAVNSLIISLISSAKTLADFLKRSAEKWLKENESEKDKYNVYASKVYDTNFGYFMLYNLRNFSQHGYFPVSFQEGKYCFDIRQILDTPHISFNANFKRNLEEFLKNTEKPGETISCISLTITTAEFTTGVIDIYKKFLSYFKQKICSSHNDIRKIIKNKPTIICNYHEDYIGYIFYDKDERSYHTFDTRIKPSGMMDHYKKQISKIYDNEKQELNKLYEKFFDIK